MPRKLKRTLPGDTVIDDRDGGRRNDIHSMIRVDHAGEYGAKRIYEGQLSVLGKDAVIRKMAEQEQAHLDYFDKEIVSRQVRPTAGYTLGALTAKMGREAAMAGTVAVETVISEHYADQLRALKNNPKEKKLRAAIKKFKAEEEEHHDIGVKHGADYPLLTKLIKSGARLAIVVAKRV
jgi:ubiquinone biosynthesis monooxygenase Coq7